MLHWLTAFAALSPAALTVRAQAVPVNDQGRLYWETYFPRADVQSIRLSDIMTTDFRPVGERRPWDGDGRQLPVKYGDYRNWEMVPIEVWHSIGEYEIQRLSERNGFNEELVRRALGVEIPQRTEMMASAVYRRLELDYIEAWTAGQITVRNPQDGSTQVVSLQLTSGRITTAGTAWNNGAVNGYDELVAWLRTGQDTIGPIEGVRLRRATLSAIEADAPTNLVGMKMTTSEIAQRIGDFIQSPFRFEVIEDHFDRNTGAAQTWTATKNWPAQKVAAIPAGGAVGRSYFAPVLRAAEIVGQAAGVNTGIDLRGVTLFYFGENGGKNLKIQAQLNALPIPDDQRVWVIDAGV